MPDKLWPDPLALLHVSFECLQTIKLQRNQIEDDTKYPSMYVSR